jgi:Putative peptidoglycan binding domain
MTMADATLMAALKQAKSKKMFFAFVPKGADGKLIVSKAKIPAKQVAEAKKEIGGGTAITGKCFGDGNTMIFQVVKAAPSNMGPTLKKVIHRDAGLTMIPEVQLASDADSDEEDESGVMPPGADAAAGDSAAAGASAPAGNAAAAAPPGAAAAGQAPPKPAAGGQANVMGFQKALQKLGYDPGKIDGIMGPHTKAAAMKFQQASGLKADGIIGPKTQAALAKAMQGGAAAGAAGQTGPAPAGTTAPGAATPPPATPSAPPAGRGNPNLGPWQAARQEAITDLRALAGKIAATKHGSAAGVLKEIQSIISRLPANPAANDIDKLEDFVRNDDTITAAEEVPSHFHKLEIRKPLLVALEGLKK